jgi:hypothetical protein
MATTTGRTSLSVQARRQESHAQEEHLLRVRREQREHWQRMALWLYRKRLSRGWTQRQVSAFSGVSQTTVSQWAQGLPVSPATVAAISATFASHPPTPGNEHLDVDMPVGLAG